MPFTVKGSIRGERVLTSPPLHGSCTVSPTLTPRYLDNSAPNRIPFGSVRSKDPSIKVSILRKDGSTCRISSGKKRRVQIMGSEKDPCIRVSISEKGNTERRFGISLTRAHREGTSRSPERRKWYEFNSRMASMLEYWKPFITPRTVNKVITPAAMPKTERKVGT